jgi:hypothetical protein
MKCQVDGLIAKGIPSAFINRSMIPEDIPAVKAHILEWRVTASRPKV